ncbi:MAG: ATP-binding protein, partial [Clostridiales bacterium]|nr:ATP-binding protein [Clostridiales bacterium]
ESEENDYYKINSIHSSSTVNDNPSIPLNNESAGTLKMFALYPSLKEVFENGGLLVIDELNAKLHPLLVRNILISFLNPEININNAQIIFTTHDVWQLSTGLLRRDEIWFTDKDDEGISDLYSLADFKDENDQKIRKDAAFERNYVTGSYRAIPSLKPINILKDNKNEK